MAIELLTSARDFLSRTLALRTADPFRTNILGSVATSVADGSLTYDDYLWWIATNELGQVVGAAMRTAPHGMVLSPMSSHAISELALAVSKHDDALPSVSGPTSVVVDFIENYRKTLSAGSQRRSALEEEHLLYALTELSMPWVGGKMNTATQEDFGFLLDWYRNFGDDTGVFMPNPEGSIRAGLGRGSYRFWVVGEERVSMAGHAPLVDTPDGKIARIGPVYTPPEHRRNGYAGALTAAVSRELLDFGARVMLYTDAENPTSNSIYRKIGFEMISQNVLYTFADESA